MKLLVHSYFPVLKIHQAGGAQYMLYQILIGLAKRGIKIMIICPEAPDNSLISFENISTRAILKEKRMKSLTLQERAYNLQQIALCVNEADVVLTLDAHFPLEIKQPIVLSLATIAYEDELNSLLGFNWDSLILSSRYLEASVKAIIDPIYWSKRVYNIHVIQLGIDTDAFIQTDTQNLHSKLAISPGRYLLFPHRPEPAKGFATALAVLQQLVQYDTTYRLLIPTHPESVKYCIAKERAYYQRLIAKVRRMGLADFVIFHHWIGLHDLPAYYSLGEWCLVLSQLPEGFGLTPVHSIGCGTPVISTRSGALRERFPPRHGVFYVDPKDVQQIVAYVLQGAPDHEVQQGRKYVEQEYCIETCVHKYADCLWNVSRGISTIIPAPKASSLRLSPWCYILNQHTIWHDLNAHRIHLSQQQAVIVQMIAQGTYVHNENIKSDHVDWLLDQGILVSAGIE